MAQTPQKIVQTAGRDRLGELERVEKLRKGILDFWQSKHEMTKDEMEGISFSGSDLLQLKILLSDTNNVITYLLTRSFTRWLQKVGLISDAQYERMITDIDHQNVNANGFDVDFQDEGLSIVAEAKANLPVADKRFGAAQLSALKKDVKGLSVGKQKGRGKKRDLSDAYKFLVLLNSDHIEQACNHLIEYCRTKMDPQVQLTPLKTDEPIGSPAKLDKKVIYIVKVSLNVV